MQSDEAEPSSRAAHKNFNLLWAGQSLSLLGNQFLVIGLPLFALQVVGATAAQAVLLPFLMFVPFLLIGLPVGALVDRLPKRKTMVLADIVQMVVYSAIAILAMQGAITFIAVTALVFVAGVASVFFQVAYNSLLPEIYSGARELQKGNAKLFFSESIARLLGPMAAGPTIAVFAPPIAILINGASFLVSALTLSAIRKPEIATAPRARTSAPTSIVADIKVGLQFVFAHPKLQPVFLCGAVYVLFVTAIEASLVIYCKDVLKLTPTAIGLVIGAAAAGFPVANLISSRMLSALGISRTLVISATTAVSGLFLIAVFGASGSVTGLIAASVLHGLGEGVFGPTSTTLRQTQTPMALLGRVNSVQRFMLWGAIPLGSAMTSLIIKYIGLEWTLWVGGIGASLCLLPLIRRGILADLREPNPPLSADAGNT